MRADVPQELWEGLPLPLAPHRGLANPVLKDSRMSGGELPLAASLRSMIRDSVRYRKKGIASANSAQLKSLILLISA